MATKELTKRQQLVLKFIQRNIRATGYPPTLREIGAQLGIKSTNGVSDHLNALMKKGYLAKESGKSRTLSLLKPKTLGQKSDLIKNGIPVFTSALEGSKLAGSGLMFAVFEKESQQITIYRAGPTSPTVLSTFHFAN